MFLFRQINSLLFMLTCNSHVALSMEPCPANTVQPVTELQVNNTLTVTPITPKISPKAQIATEFKIENLGRVMSVLGIVRNKVIEEKIPLFTDFAGGEWVLIPFRREQRLSAVIFYAYDEINYNHCIVITQKSFDPESHTTNFSLAPVHLTDLYLVKKHFNFNRDESPKEYNGPLEKDFWEECDEWLEDNPQELDFVHKKTRRGRIKTPSLPSSQSSPLSTSSCEENFTKERETTKTSLSQ